MDGVRYANIGFVVGTVIIVAGVFLFKDSSEAAVQAVAMIGIFTGLAVALILDERAKRRDKEHSQ